MTARGASRFWLLGGVVAIVALVTATYLLAIRPVYDDRALKESQAADRQQELVKLKHTLADLETKNAHYASYLAQLKAKQKQLPDNYDIANFLRQLQTSDTTVKVDNNSIAVSAPTVVEGSPNVVGTMITMNATGKIADLTRFVARLQNSQDRAVLPTTVGLTAGDTDEESTLSVNVVAFCSKNDENDCKVTA